MKTILKIFGYSIGAALIIASIGFGSLIVRPSQRNSWSAYLGILVLACFLVIISIHTICNRHRQIIGTYVFLGISAAIVIFIITYCCQQELGADMFLHVCAFPLGLLLFGVTALMGVGDEDTSKQSSVGP